MTARTDRVRWYIDPKAMARNSEQEGAPLGTPSEGQDPNLVSSLLEDGRHSPVLDLDFPVRLVPSRTPGHFHLYLDGLEMDWEDYQVLLGHLVDAGVIGVNYAYRSIAQGQTVLRAEGTFRPHPPEVEASPAPWEDEEPF